MIAALRKWRYNKELTEVLRKAPQAKSRTNAAHRIAILSDDGSNPKAIDTIIQRLNATGRLVNHLRCVDTSSKEDEPGIVFSNQKTWYGWPTGDSFEAFTGGSYDIYFVLATSDTTIIKACIATVKAELKAGTTLHSPFLDLIVDRPADQTQQVISNILDMLDVLSK